MIKNLRELYYRQVLVGMLMLCEWEGIKNLRELYYRQAHRQHAVPEPAPVKARSPRRGLGSRGS